MLSYSESLRKFWVILWSSWAPEGVYFIKVLQPLLCALNTSEIKEVESKGCVLVQTLTSGFSPRIREWLIILLLFLGSPHSFLTYSPPLPSPHLFFIIVIFLMTRNFRVTRCGRINPNKFQKRKFHWFFFYCGYLQNCQHVLRNMKTQICI